MYITICVIDGKEEWKFSPSSMHETGHSKLVHWDNPEGWDGMGREVGGGFWIGDTFTHMADLMSMYGKNHHNIVK